MNIIGRIMIAIGLSAAIMLAGGCKTKDDGPPPPDVSAITADIAVKRFEQDLFGLDSLSLLTELAALEERNPDFTDVFFRYVLNIRTGEENTKNVQAEAAFMQGFIEFPALRNLYDTVQVTYPNLNDYKKELDNALRYFKYYFPEQPAPSSVTTFIAEYSLAAFVYGQNELAVGLDLFLGADYPYAKFNPGNTNFSDYLIRTYNQDHLTAKTLIPLVSDLTGDPPGDRLLDFMLHNGKKLYIMEQLLPYTSDTVIMEVTPLQLQWLKNNEREMWAHFLKEELLYNSSWPDIRKLVEPSPNSPGMPPEAPGRSANWVGWQIVKTYMRRFPQTTLPELINLRDSQKLLDDSKYKPGWSG